MALMQHLTEVAAGILIYSAGNAELAKVLYGVSLVPPLSDGLGMHNSLAITPMSTLSVTVVVRTGGSVHKICR